MDTNSIADYEKNLKELELEREKLEKVMKVMGKEWEKSGAGIGWLGQIDGMNTVNHSHSSSEHLESLNKVLAKEAKSIQKS